MKLRFDLSALLSLTAIAGVCVAVTVHAMPELPPPLEAPRPRTADPKRDELDKPARTLELDKALREISGLGPSADGKSLWAVHDEKPFLYRLAMDDGSVLQKVDLGEPGDYESVEEAHGRVWVANSDGTLHVVDPTGDHPIETLGFTNQLGMPCDLEGMAWDEKRHRMLLACKSESVKVAKDGKVHAIYALDVEERKLDPEPVITINQADLDAKGVKGKSFAPSGIAVHPKTGELWVVSAHGEMVVVLSPEGEVKRVLRLDPKVHRQPEGIAFASDGTMYISNEGRGRKATLQVFAPK